MSQHVDLVVLALHSLGGHARSVDTEDVAMVVHGLAPDRFSWKKYPEQVNLELVRVSLSDGKKASGGQRVIGSGREGWRLSAKGVRWASKNHSLSETEDYSRERARGHGGGIDERRWRAERSRIMASGAWASFVAGERIAPNDALSLFRIDVYATGKLRAGKVARLVARFSDDEQVGAFLEAVEKVLPIEQGSKET